MIVQNHKHTNLDIKSTSKVVESLVLFGLRNVGTVEYLILTRKRDIFKHFVYFGLDVNFLKQVHEQDKRTGDCGEQP